MKRNMPSDLGWGNVPEGGCSPQSFTSGSGSWTSTANQDSGNSSSMWQGMGKSDSASDTGDDASSGKSGSTISSMNNTTSQSQDTTSISSTSATPTSSSSLWNTSSATLSGLDASPWGNSNSPAPSGAGPVGWSSNPSSLSLSSSQSHNNMQAGSNILGSSAGSSSGWSPSVTGSGLANNSGLSSGSGMQPNTLSSQWQSSTLLGNIGDFVKTSDSGWTNPTSSSLLDSSKDGAGSVAAMRMWGLSADSTGDSQWAPGKNQWGNAGSVAGSEQGASSSEQSFAQVTQKGLKIQPPTNGPPTPLSSRQEEILRAIENHEGWGSRPIRQDTSWDVEISPKSLRKFSAANNEATNVWNNSNGTAIWEAFRENQRSNLTGGTPAANSYISEKDQPNWAGPARIPQDPNTWNIGNNANGKDFGTWGVTGGAGDASNKMWGQKTEVGSWGEPGVQRSSTSMSSWGDDGDAGAWEDPRRVSNSMGNMQVMPPSSGMGVPAVMGPRSVGGVGMIAGGVDATTPWNDGQKQGWNSASAAVVTRTNVDEPWNKPPPVRSGWGETAHDATEVDNGTGLWSSNVPKQAKVPNWTDASPQGQWNAAVGAKSKIPAGWDEASWNLAQRAKQMPQKFVSNGSNPPTQMRAKLLQHLLDLGFRKEEAQAALITNNLNLDMAINDLKAGNVNMSRKDLDLDVFQPNGSQSQHMPYMSKGGMGSDKMSDLRLDQVPNFNNMQNTPFPNAQISNQPFVQSNASLPPSSLNLNNSSITPNLQQKLMQKIQQQQPPPSAALGQRAPMPPASSGASSQVPPQQQQQILAQLRQAVSNGFISPQLINYQLPHNILVLLQQLLQLQSALQNVMGKQQQLMQQARATGNRSNPQQMEQMSGIISNINQQIINVQKQLQQAQSALFSSQKPPVASQPPSNALTSQSGVNMMDSLDALSNDLAIVALQNQSRLSTQWKLDMSSSSGTDSSNNSILPSAGAVKATDNIGDNKTSGLRGTMQSSSSSNLNLISGGLGMTGDKTWSSNLSATSTPSWPLSTDNLSTNSQTDQKAPSSTSMSTSILSGSSGFTDVIPEFVPGKPWQGFTKNVEDDPHVTPGSIQYQRSLSVNRVHDESLNHLDGNKFSGSSWSSGLKNDNSLGLSQLGSHPPPAMVASKGIGGQQWSTGGFNRQTSWPHSSTSAFTKVTGSGWNDSNVAPSSWLLLKNLTVDASTVRALSAQHGTLVSFYPLAQGQFALVQYATREMAFVSQQRLNNFQMGSTVITAEFISETDAQRVAAQIPPPPPPQASSIPPVNNSLWSQAPPSTPFQNAGMRTGDPWSSSASHHSSKYGSGGENYWGLWDRPEHNPNPLSNILGGESM